MTDRYKKYGNESYSLEELVEYGIINKRIYNDVISKTDNPLLYIKENSLYPACQIWNYEKLVKDFYNGDKIKTINNLMKEFKGNLNPAQLEKEIDKLEELK